MPSSKKSAGNQSSIKRKANTQNTISTDQAREALIKARRERTQRAAKAIDAILKKENCVLDATFTVSARGIIPKIDIIPKNNIG